MIGVGANTSSPPDFPLGPVQLLPGALSQGILVNQPGGYFQFGPNPLEPFASVAGSPETNHLQISVNYGSFVTTNGAFVDTGGVHGTLPENLLPPFLSNSLSVGDHLPANTIITVQTDSGTLLYSEQTGAGSNAMLVGDSDTAGGHFNTGNYVYSLMPIYTSYSPAGGTTYFDKLS
jgi:hypothetical protein